MAMRNAVGLLRREAGSTLFARRALPAGILRGANGVAMRSAATTASDDRGGMTDAMYNWRVVAIMNALKQRGKETGDLAVEDLTSLGHLDQYHYLGIEANDHVIDILGLDDSVHVLDIGSGIGGPARYISSKSGCRITGIELQEDICVAGDALTKRVPGLGEKVGFQVGDIIALSKEGKIAPASFDHFMSLLVFLHIPDRTALLDACFAALKPGGTFVIEDFAAKPGLDFTAQETDSLLNVVSAPNVSTPAKYVEDLEKAGFVDIEVVNLSDIWQRWARSRHVLYAESKEETVRTQGEKIYNDRVAFYKVVDDLFAGNLGGARITGRRPSELEARLLKGREKDFGDGGTVHVVEGMTRERVGMKQVQ